jgi:PAS domain S-box-containing protein
MNEHRPQPSGPSRPRGSGNAALQAADPEADRLADLIQGIDAIVWEMSIDTCRYTYVGGRAEELLGYPARRWLDDADFNRIMVHPDDYERVADEGRRATAEARDHRIEYRAVAATGRVLWLRDWIRVVPGREGRPGLLRGITVDITEHKEAESALRESEERLRQIAGAIEDVVYMDDSATGRYLYVSPAYEQLWGRSCDSLYADPDSWLEAVHPDDRGRVAGAMERLAAAGFEGEWREEYRLVRPDGTVRWVWDVSAPVRDATGRIVRMVGCTRDITRRKEAEAALREREESFRQIMAAIRDNVYMEDVRGGRFLYVSPAYGEIWGRDADTLCQDYHSWLEALHPEDRPRIRESLEALAAAAYAHEWRQEYRVVRPDGSVRWVWDHAVPIPGEGGVVERMVGSARDITERKRWEAALREAQERFEVVCRATMDAVYDWDMRTDVVRWNEGTLTLFGYGADAVGPDPGWWADKLHPDDRDRIVRGVEDLIESTGHAWVGEYRFRRAEGGYAHVLDRGHVLRDERGHPVRMIGSMQDVTARREAEEALRQAEAKYRTLFENALIGIFQTTPDGRVLAANRTMARILGYDSSEDLLANLRDVRTGLYADPAVRPRLLERLEAEGALEDLEIQVRRKDGEIVWVSANIRADRDPDGRLVRIEGVYQDITERRRAEEALRQVSARLLRSQDQERRRIARELHDGTAQMLAALGMNLEALRKGAGQVTGAGRARLAGSRRLLEQCVQEIRTLSYLLHPPLLDEAGLTTAIRSYARGFAERSGIRVDVRLPRAAGRLPDEIELTLFRVVQESLSNIHRHSGSPVARIGMGRHNGRVRLVVRDQGRGMGAARTRIGVAGPAPGIGVGIAGMRERVRHLGGDLIIDLSPRGTTVKVSLPV